MDKHLEVVPADDIFYPTHYFSSPLKLLVKIRLYFFLATLFVTMIIKMPLINACTIAVPVRLIF